MVDPDGMSPRLLISSQERRVDPPPPGRVYALPLDSPAQAPVPQRLLLTGRDACSFHPHGISVVERDGHWLLYVINHHEPADATPRSDCLSSAGAEHYGKPFTSIEVFEVQERRLRFLQRLVDLDGMPHANDLVALANGDVYVTMPPKSPRHVVWERWRGNAGSAVAHFDCSRRVGFRCGYDSPQTLPLGRYVNGIAHRPAGEASPASLYVASTLEEVLYEIPLKDGSLPEADDVRQIPAPAGLDNLEWLDDRRTALLAAAHPDLRRFLQHGRSSEAPSPSQVWRIDLHAPARAQLFAEPGGSMSAASTALCHQGDLFLGQVFDAAVLRCLRPMQCRARGGRHGTGE